MEAIHCVVENELGTYNRAGLLTKVVVTHINVNQGFIVFKDFPPGLAYERLLLHHLKLIKFIVGFTS
jgi:hypothetical protein